MEKNKQKPVLPRSGWGEGGAAFRLQQSLENLVKVTGPIKALSNVLLEYAAGRKTNIL